MIIGLQIIGIVFSLSMIYFSLVNYKKGEINKREFYSWALIWIGTAFIVVFPELLRTVSYNFLITRLFDLMVVVAFLIVISMSAVMYVRTRKLEKKLEELVRTLAIKDTKKSNPPKKK